MVDKFQQTKTAFDLIKTGEFKKIIEGISIIFGCGIVALLGAAVALVFVLVAIIVELCAEVLLFVLLVALGIVVLFLAVLGFIYVVLPNL